MKNLYEILGIKKDEIKGNIKKAYRKLSKIHHPDVGGDKEMFILIRVVFCQMSLELKYEQYLFISKKKEFLIKKKKEILKSIENYIYFPKNYSYNTKYYKLHKKEYVRNLYKKDRYEIKKIKEIKCKD